MERSKAIDIYLGIYDIEGFAGVHSDVELRNLRMQIYTYEHIGTCRYIQGCIL